eukprot:403348737
MSQKQLLNLKPTELEKQLNGIVPKNANLNVGERSSKNNKANSKQLSLRVSKNNSKSASKSHSKAQSSDEDDSDNSSSDDQTSSKSSDSSDDSSKVSSSKNKKNRTKSKSKSASPKRGANNKRKSSDNTSSHLDNDQNEEDEEEEEELVKFNMNFTQLNDYLNNIIKVINQHAKLLNTLNNEIQLRTTEGQIGEIFSLIATGLPYDQLIKKLGGQAPGRRGSVMKLLGDATLLPAGISIMGDRLTSSVQSLGGAHQKQPSTDEMSFGIANQKLPSKSQMQILEGTERFLRATEMIGKYLVDLKEYSHQNDCALLRMQSDIDSRLTKNEFIAVSREKRKKLKNKLRNALENQETKVQSIDQKLSQQMQEFTKKLSDVELNTYWKIKDYEDLLAQRVSETYMKDFVKGECNKLQRDYKDHIEKEQTITIKRVESLELDVRKVKDVIGAQIGELQKGTDTFTAVFEQEREANEKRVDDLRSQLQSRIIQIEQNDNQVQQKLTQFEKKLAFIEKMSQDNKFAASKQPMTMDFIDLEKYDELKSMNDKLQKKLQKMSKNLKKSSENSKQQIEGLQNEIARKAEKDSLIQNQQKFFDNLTQMENETDASITKLVGEELKKLGEQISSNNKIIEKKIQKVYTDLDVEKLSKQIEKKVNKEEIQEKFTGWDGKINLVDKSAKNLQSTVQRLESFTENLALAIRNLENQTHKVASNLNGGSALQKQQTSNFGNDLSQPNLLRSPTRYQSQTQVLEVPQQPMLQNVHSMSVYDQTKLDFPSPIDQLRGRAVYGNNQQDIPKSINSINSQFNSRHSNVQNRPQSSGVVNKSNSYNQSNNSHNNSFVRTNPKPSMSGLVSNSNNNVSGIMANAKMSHHNPYTSQQSGLRPQTQDSGLRISGGGNIASKTSFTGINNNNSASQVIKGGPLNKLLNLSNGAAGELSQATGVTSNKAKLNLIKSKHSGFMLANQDENSGMPQIERVFRQANND